MRYGCVWQLTADRRTASTQNRQVQRGGLYFGAPTLLVPHRRTLLRLRTLIFSRCSTRGPFPPSALSPEWQVGWNVSCAANPVWQGACIRRARRADARNGRLCVAQIPLTSLPRINNCGLVPTKPQLRSPAAPSATSCQVSSLLRAPHLLQRVRAKAPRLCIPSRLHATRLSSLVGQTDTHSACAQFTSLIHDPHPHHHNHHVVLLHPDAHLPHRELLPHRTRVPARILVLPAGPA